MNNPRFYQLLGLARQTNGAMWTTEALAAGIHSSRAHVTQVLNNKPGRGHQTRRKLVVLFKENFTFWRDILASLGWTESGERAATDNGVMSGIEPASSSE